MGTRTIRLGRAIAVLADLVFRSGFQFPGGDDPGKGISVSEFSQAARFKRCGASSFMRKWDMGSFVSVSDR